MFTRCGDIAWEVKGGTFMPPSAPRGWRRHPAPVGLRHILIKIEWLSHAVVNANHSGALSSHRKYGNRQLAAASTKWLRYCNISKERRSQRERVLNQARLNPKPMFPALCQSPPWPHVGTAALCGIFWARPVLYLETALLRNKSVEFTIVYGRIVMKGFW